MTIKLDENETNLRFNELPDDQRTWHRISQEDADYILEVLPPIYFPGGFACSEPCSFDEERGASTYQCVVSCFGKFYTAVRTIGAAKEEARLIRSR